MERNVFVTYCDEVRFEATGKRIYIGVYDSVLFASSFPATLPQFAIVMQIATPVSDPFQKLHIEVKKDSDVLASLSVDDIELTNAASSASVDSRRIVATAILQIQGVSIEKEGFIQVFVHTEREVLESTKLKLALREGSVVTAA